ncbi:hypothetical protein Q6348_04270 [Isoptericola sp. b441]|uniref:Uncharacterized protein n=1 Tax=Actinotalea lenta TaxID=3064654 RepID=A0ABT9DB31_9CELL|nr:MULTISPECIES: DUF2231 domain-containing protein [unclassified Isoptericola]MDO8106408.1 hypothetical protein [Isoptericola sp. b441]MDO8121887.1 hypothetical protein [Isoptericola sp. b490]
MPATIGGLPVHPLVVHAAVVLVPVAAVTVLLAALWPRFRRWSGWLPAVLAIGAFGAAAVAKETGEALLAKVPGSAELARHMALGTDVALWSAVLVVVAGGVTLTSWVERRLPWMPALPDRIGVRTGDAVAMPTWWSAVVAVLAVVVAAGVTIVVVLAGHSGATAVWTTLLPNG